MQWLQLRAVLCGALLPVALKAVDESCDASTSFLQVGSALQKESRIPYWYPSRGVDHNRSGWSSAAGPFPLQAPQWKFEVPGINFHQTPCIDDQLNVYTGSDLGTIFSFTKEGRKRWETVSGGIRCQNPTILDGLLYTACSNGNVMALTMDEGKISWSMKLADSLPHDTYTISAAGDYLVVPFDDIGNLVGGARGLAVLERADGHVRWTYNISANSGGAYTINMAPCLLDDSLITSDTSGNIYRLSLKDGSEIWRKPAEHAGNFTLGGVACGEGMVFNGFSRPDNSGALQALSMDTGDRLWEKSFPAAIHNAPAVGRLYGSGRMGVIAGVGEPTGPPLPIPEHINGTVVAVDPMDGELLWTFEPPVWHWLGSAGSSFQQLCYPDLFSAATIDVKGTVYINWSAGGITYGLRDANADGFIDAEDPLEVSSYDLGSGATGPPAVAPGMLFVNTCRRPSAFLT